jgi:hypothetical protein
MKNRYVHSFCGVNGICSDHLLLVCIHHHHHHNRRPSLEDSTKVEPVFTSLAFATIFFCKEQGYQPCVQPQPGGPDLCICLQWPGWPSYTPSTGFHFRPLLRLAGLRRRYSNQPPHGVLLSITCFNIVFKHPHALWRVGRPLKKEQHIHHKTNVTAAPGTGIKQTTTKAKTGVTRCGKNHDEKF